jgi:hypothetical protein
MPVASSSATHVPPISAASTIADTSTMLPSGTTKNASPKRSRRAAAIVCLLTAAKRPDISTRKIAHSPASTMTHAS